MLMSCVDGRFDFLTCLLLFVLLFLSRHTVLLMNVMNYLETARVQQELDRSNSFKWHEKY